MSDILFVLLGYIAGLSTYALYTNYYIEKVIKDIEKGK